VVLNTVKVPEEFEPIFLKAEEYVGKYFSERREDPTKGLIEVFGERYVLIRAASMSVDFFDTVKNLYRDAGEEEAIGVAKSFLFDIAHALGKADARNFHKKMNLEDPIEKLSAGPVHFSHSGWAFVDLSPESKPTPDENFYLLYDHPHSFEADSWEKSGRKSDFPVCIMNAGYSSGWCEESFGISLVTVEILCRAKGDNVCRFIMAHPSKIEDHIAEYLEKDPELAKKITKYEIPGFFVRKQIEDERRCAEEELKETTGILQSVMDSATEEIIATTDQNGTILSWNEGARRLLGYEASEVVGRESVRIFHTEEFLKSGRMESTIEKIITERVGVVLEIDYVRKDGTVFPVQQIVTPRFNEAGEFIGMLGMARDITEQKRNENLIRAQRDLALSLNSASGLDSALSLCVDSAIAISGMDCGGVYLVNESYGSLDLVFHRGLPANFIGSASHYDSDSDNARLVMAGLPVYSRHHEIDTEVMDDVRRGEELRATAILPVLHDGKVIACLNVSSHTHDEVPAFARDVLEAITAQAGSAIARAKADHALHEERDRAKQYFDVVGAIILTIDPDRKVRHINRKGCEILGLEESEIVGRDWFENFIPEEFRSEIAGVFESLMAGGAEGFESAEYHENPVPTKEGEERIIAWHNVVLRNEDGTIAGILSSGEDVTERKVLEQKLQGAFEELKKSYEEVSIPVIQACDNVLVIPIIGTLDGMRATRLTETMLSKIADTKSLVVIIDITGVHSIDSSVASHIFNVVQAAGLLGAECVVTGIAPDIAKSMIALDVDIAMVTRATLQEGLAYAMRKVSVKRDLPVAIS